MTHDTPLVLQHLKKALLQLRSAKGVLILEEMKDSQAYLRTKSAISQTEWAIEEIEKLQKESGNE
jgi:ribosomal protein L29